MDWFDIDKIDNKTYIIRENKHYEKVNVYYLIGKDFNICVDSGMGLHRIGPVLDKLDSKERRLIITHSHWDHIGNHDQFNEVYYHLNARALLKTGELTPLEIVKEELVRGVEDKYIPRDFDIETYRLYDGANGITLEDGYVIDQGDRQLEVIYTPGHTTDSISIFERETGYLFVGDFLYRGPLYCGASNNDPHAYHSSLKNLIKSKYRAVKVFSAHYEPDLGKDYIAKAFELFDRAHKEGNLYKGFGSYRYKDMEIIL